MSPLLPLSNVTERVIQDAVREALRGGVDSERLGAFLALIDWSGKDDSETRDTLAMLHAWNVEFADGAMAEWQFMAALLSLLPQNERSHWVFANGAPTSVLTRVPAVAPRDQPGTTLRSAPRNQVDVALELAEL